jgi:hypothetical protein
MPIRSDRSEYRGACQPSNRTSVSEMASAVVCGSLFLAVLILAGYAVYQCMERQGQKLLDGPVWHELLDIWSLSVSPIEAPMNSAMRS